MTHDMITPKLYQFTITVKAAECGGLAVWACSIIYLCRLSFQSEHRYDYICSPFCLICLHDVLTKYL